MVANIVGVVLVVTCAWGEGLHERRLGGGVKAQGASSGRIVYYDANVRFRTPGFICCRLHRPLA